MTGWLGVGGRGRHRQFPRAHPTNSSPAENASIEYGTDRTATEIFSHGGTEVNENSARPRIQGTNSATSNAPHVNTSSGESGHASPYKTATEITLAMGKIRNSARIVSHVRPGGGALRLSTWDVALDDIFQFLQQRSSGASLSAPFTAAARLRSPARHMEYAASAPAWPGLRSAASEKSSPALA